MAEADAELPEGAPSDGTVVARVLSGDRDAYRMLVRRHQDRLYRYALHMTRQHDTASDLVQDSLVKAYTRLHKCRNPERFGAWVYQIVVNACKDYFRNRRRRNVSLDDDEYGTYDPPLSDADPARDIERSELRDRLERALARLPEQQREAFVLKHVEQRSYREMTELLDASVSALKMRVHRAREALMVDLEEVLE